MTPTPNSQMAIQHQIDALGDRMDAGVAEIKEMLHGYEERTRAIEQAHAGCYPLITARVDAQDKKLSEHDARLASKSQEFKSLEAQVVRLIPMYRILVFLGSTLLVSVMALIWSIVMGQAQVVFR